MSFDAGAGDAARRIGATLIDIVRTRIELGATELAEERARSAQQALAAALALLFGSAGLVLAVIALAWWTPAEHRGTVLAAGGALFLAAGAGAVWRWRAIARARPPLLHDTLEQLRADARALLP